MRQSVRLLLKYRTQARTPADYGPLDLFKTSRNNNRIARGEVGDERR